MEDSLKEELEEVDCQLVCLEQELETLLQRQQELQDRRQLLQTQLESIKNVQHQEERSKLEATDWEHGIFPWSEEARAILNSFFKLDAFRSLQLSCINATLSKKDVILIMPTGGGKSLCYQLPAVFGNGITLVISPLVSLMEDQLLAVQNLGIEVATYCTQAIDMDMDRTSVTSVSVPVNALLRACIRLAYVHTLALALRYCSLCMLNCDKFCGCFFQSQTTTLTIWCYLASS